MPHEATMVEATLEQEQVLPEKPGPSKAAGSRAHAAHGPALYFSPASILSQLQPPNCSIRLNNNDWRWSSSFKGESPTWVEEFANSTFSRSFDRSNWKSKLMAVHSHCWLKWSLARDAMPLDPGSEEQIPGQIPEEIFQELGPVIAKLPTRKKYWQ